jgi:hypothetical protein
MASGNKAPEVAPGKQYWQDWKGLENVGSDLANKLA